MLLLNEKIALNTTFNKLILLHVVKERKKTNNAKWIVIR